MNARQQPVERAMIAQFGRLSAAAQLKFLVLALKAYASQLQIVEIEAKEH